MTRSRRRKLMRERPRESARALLKCLPAVSFALAGGSAFAQQEPSEGALQEIVVTAQKRAENLQNVPISIQALGEEKLEQMNVKSFDDYAKLLPSLNFQTAGPGYSTLTIRGVSSGGTDWGGSLPTVGTYLDEQPVTTISGTLDVHIYDIQRVEALAGPQGTLYGASSESGTVRIITNKPDPRRFEAAYEVSGDTVAHGGQGGFAQGFVNVPLGEHAAVRLVGWHEHDPGYINNVPSTRTFPVSGICIANTNPPPAGCQSSPSLARRGINDVTITGGRAVLKIDLNDSWTIMPMVMAQQTDSAGYSGNGYNPSIGPLETDRFYPDHQVDHWIDVALTIQGKVGDLDLTYAGAFLKRSETNHADYSDYSLAYDAYLSSYFKNNAGHLINPTLQTLNAWRYKKQSHELRVTSPQENALRFVAGLFMQRQEHDIVNRYQVPGLAQSLWVTGWPETWWLTDQVRTDRDYAAFSEVTYQITPKLTATGGIRFFKVDNTMNGFYGYGAGTDAVFGSRTGQAGCFAPGVQGAPCMDLNKEAKETGHTPKLNLTYHFDDHKMVYATYSQGFRPGGINRFGSIPPYKSDKLNSYEIGWKTAWAGNRVRFNGAAFVEDWKNFQFSFLGPSGIAEFANAGEAQIKGIESSLEWAVSSGLTVSGAMTVLDPKLTENYCGALDANSNPIINCAAPLAPNGTQLPGTSRFKGSSTARYEFRVGGVDAHVQGTFSYQSGEWADLRVYERSLVGRQSPYGLADLSAGIARDSYWGELFVNNAFDRLGQESRYTECAIAYCAAVGTYIIPTQSRTIGLRFGQRF